MRRFAPSAAGSTSTWATVAPGAISRPCRVVHMLSVQPHATITSAPRISSAASGAANPPATSRYQGPEKRPFATAEVASSAPHRSARSASAGPAARAPRPAMNTGRCAPASRSASCPTAAGAGATSGSSGSTTDGGTVASPAWTSSGRLSTTVRRSALARRTARIASSTAESAVAARSWAAPTAAASPAWSSAKLDRAPAAPVSAASTTIGVRLFAASAIPVSALVSPGPWCTVSTPSRPERRA